MSAMNDGSESVDQFLARIANVKSGHDEEDQERNRRMEEEFIKNRKERQARRAERARSISPSKTGPAATLSLNLDAAPVGKATNPPVTFSPQSQGLSRSNAISAKTSPTLEPTTSHNRPLPSPTLTKDPSNTSNTLSRSGTLSWQQRPSSRDGSSRPRPLSSFATVRNLPKPISNDNEEQEPTRQEIAASLGLKDPSWFRQTQDRGLNSAAYRKTQVEDAPQENNTIKSMQLPGLSRENSNRARSPLHEQAPSTSDSTRQQESQEELSRFKRGDTPDMVALRNSMVFPAAQKSTGTSSSSSRTVNHDIKNEDRASSEDRASGTTVQGGRSPSPVKGLGGFVESAMMKRSDSVSKRWNVQTSSGLQRGDSVAGSRPSALGSGRGLAKDRQLPRDDLPSSPLSSSRPQSSHQSTAKSPSFDRPVSSNSQTPEKVDSTASRSRPEFSPKPISTEKPTMSSNEEDLLSRSPSKTMDPRRWSPTKSSWLESALQAKPEPPKMQPLRDQQPSWMVDLQRSKSRASRDPSPEKISKNAPRDPVSTADFSRPAPSFSPSRPFSMHSPTKSMSWNNDKPSSPEAKQTDSEVLQDPIAKEKDNSHSEIVSKSESQQELPNSATGEVSGPISGELDKPKAVVTPPKKPPALKAKPETPPKTDFRSSLKPKPTQSSQNGEDQAEFKSVFGKLKPTKTQNYVAPDVLKNNILTGKAALTVTGGPQKTKRVDEFKESILAKKEEMNSGAGPLHKRTESREKPEEPVPEALARRKTLSKSSTSPVRRSDTTSANTSTDLQNKPKLVPKPKEIGASSQEENDVRTTSHAPRNAVTPKSAVTKPIAGSARSPPQVRAKPDLDTKADSFGETISKTSTRSSTGVEVESTSPSKKEERVKSVISLPIDQATSLPPNEAGPAPSSQTSTTSKAELPPGSKLASRLNPNLAAILSRGSSPRPAVGQHTSSESVPQIGSTSGSVAIKPEKESSSGNLTHMTKGRAKGPKRRAPKAENDADVAPGKSINPQSSKQDSARSEALSPKPIETSTGTARTPVVSPKPFGTQRSGLVGVGQTKSEHDKSSLGQKGQEPTSPASTSPPVDQLKVKPAISTKSPELRKVSSNQSTAASYVVDSKPRPIAAPKTHATDKVQIASDKSPAPGREDAKTATPKIPDKPMPLTPSKSRINTPKQPPQEDDSRPNEKKPKSTNGLGLGLEFKPAAPAKKPFLDRSQLTPPPESKDKTAAPSITETSVPKKQVEDVLKAYFSTIPRSGDQADFDTAALLSKASASERCKTISNTISEITGDGKKVAMPPQQEHILFEESMYLAVHSFELEGANSKQAEVYLWCGDRVSEAAIEDAQLFCRKDAREHNAKLEVLRQGKESARFIQGLGGIVIVRRSKSSALYMLCGRRHLGHITFDEVDVSSENLCSGFPYLISAQFGNLYLWKGKGAGADEIGCARLIGMDLGLTGEIEEIDEGSEPDSFWETFASSSSKRTTSEDWSKRSELNGYPTTLYKIEHEQAKSGGFWGLRPASPPKASPKAAVTEVMPFCQRDVEGSQIYVLDAYRSIYILVNSEVSAKPAEFITAANIAQEVAMLAPSMQDRPLLPSCHVVFGEPPNEVQTCFRKWVSQSKKTMKPCLNVRLEDVLEILK